MRKALLVAIGLECLLLAGGLGLHLWGGLDRFRREPASPPVFRPSIADVRIGDSVRYEKRDRRTGKVLGYLDYEVRQVVVLKGSTIGPDILLYIKDTDSTTNASRERTMRIQPRSLMDGFLPPCFEDEDDYPAGERLVVSRISTATFRLRDRPQQGKPPVQGFLVEAVVPRRSLTEVAERYWVTDEVPVFGIARWERGDELLVLHRMEKPERRDLEQGG